MRLFDEYSIGPTVVKSVDVETIRQGRIFPSDTDLIITVNIPVIIDEWEKLVSNWGFGLKITRSTQRA